MDIHSKKKRSSTLAWSEVRQRAAVVDGSMAAVKGEGRASLRIDCTPRFEAVRANSALIGDSKLFDDS